MDLGTEQYISLTTFKRDGTPKPSPVWIVDLGDGRYGFTTNSESWKVKRIRHTARVLVQPCDAQGAVRPGTEAVEATAALDDGSEVARIKAQVQQKYRFGYPMIWLINRAKTLFGTPSMDDTAVVFQLASKKPVTGQA